MPIVWLQIAIGTIANFTLQFRLYDDEPEAREHFLRMCNGGFGSWTYARTSFHYLDPGFMLYGGVFAQCLEGQFLGFGQSVTRRSMRYRAYGPGYLVLTPSSGPRYGSCFGISLWGSRNLARGPQDFVIGEALEPNHPVFAILRGLQTQSGGEYPGPPGEHVVIVGCGQVT
ncbi:hypothetical protein DL93DRAFT_2164817 [Clavulina sp. PMI_390]|nr:hypothetical protein DL93DRAFT_2164817 [Clavulina sp. PMI_390]